VSKFVGQPNRLSGIGQRDIVEYFINKLADEGEQNMAIMGKVESLWRYPVKSVLGEELSEAFVGFAGCAGCAAEPDRPAGNRFPAPSRTLAAGRRWQRTPIAVRGARAAPRASYA
jgi:hypothetical protein